MATHKNKYTSPYAPRRGKTKDPEMAYIDPNAADRLDDILRELKQMFAALDLMRSCNAPVETINARQGNIQRFIRQNIEHLRRHERDIFAREVGNLWDDYHRRRQTTVYSYYPQQVPVISGDVTFGPTTQVAQNRVKTSIPAPPSKVCVQFIGGALNTEQKFYDVKDFPHNDRYSHAIPGEVTLKPNDVIDIGPSTTQVYKLVPIPTDETKWLPDHQVVIAVFLE